ncbi:hypothetical protein [Streptomyces sp. IGB124]|uniref:hypothetical protein n=1 Tax=Streptomyces sp. IGB124 TaxID=1519485 RepID=UPI0006B066BF|nr:hypothetical protein [Streptomyces sp. IGB124]
MEYISLALNERMSLYGPSGSLHRRLVEDGRNRPDLDAFQADLEQTPYALYEVRRLTGLGRTKDCRRWHGKSCTEPKWWCTQQRKPAAVASTRSSTRTVRRSTPHRSASARTSGAAARSRKG